MDYTTVETENLFKKQVTLTQATGTRYGTLFQCTTILVYVSSILYIHPNIFVTNDSKK